MGESILDSVKKSLGLDPDYNAFDDEIIPIINLNLMTLVQNGIGKESFIVKDSEQTWSEFLGDFQDVECAKSFVNFRVKLMFDPPSTSQASEAMTKIADECLWRCLIQVEEVRQNGIRSKIC